MILIDYVYIYIHIRMCMIMYDYLYRAGDISSASNFQRLAGPYNFSVPQGEDQYFVTNFAVLGVLRPGKRAKMWGGNG